MWNIEYRLAGLYLNSEDSVARRVNVSLRVYLWKDIPTGYSHATRHLVLEIAGPDQRGPNTFVETRTARFYANAVNNADVMTICVRVGTHPVMLQLSYLDARIKCVSVSLWYPPFINFLMLYTVCQAIFSICRQQFLSFTVGFDNYYSWIVMKIY